MKFLKNKEPRAIRKKWPLWVRTLVILGITAVFGVGSWLVSSFLMTPMYQCTATLEVDASLLDDNFWTGNNNSVIDLCVYYRNEINASAVSEQAAATLGGDYTPSKVKGLVKTVTAKSTMPTVFSISGRGTSPEEAKRVADAWANALNESVAARYGKTAAETAAVMTEAKVAEDQAPVSPNVVLNVLLATIIGFLLSYFIFSQQPVFDCIITIAFTIFTVLCIFPFYYLFINTISDNQMVSAGLINFFPQGIHFTNYINLRDVNDLFNSAMVTVARTVLGTLLMVGCSAWAGYLVTKQKMWHRKLWYRALVMTMYFNAGLIPWYTNMLMLGLTNNFLAYIIPGMIAPYNIILVKTYIESIPGSLEESAIIDGAGTATVFMKIILPLSVPILATISIFGAVGNWNSFQDSMLLMTNNAQLYTLQHRLYTYLNQATNLGAIMSSSSGQTSTNIENMLSSKVIKYTISMVTIIPILLVYPFMQRFFVKGIMLGAVKG